MKLLLDTHVWIWSVLEPDRLSKRSSEALTSPDAELWLSPISLWELLIMVEKGRFRVPGGSEAWINRAFQAAPMKEAPLTHRIVQASRRIALPHRDPADRFIAATAQVLDLTLATADAALLGAKGFKTLSCR